jgi:hypothetical protein
MGRIWDEHDVKARNWQAHACDGTQEHRAKNATEAAQGLFRQATEQTTLAQRQNARKSLLFAFFGTCAIFQRSRPSACRRPFRPGSPEMEKTGERAK